MIGVKVTKDEATPHLDSLRKGLAGALGRGVLRAAQTYEGAVRRTIYDTFKGRTGGLARSFRAQMMYHDKDKAGAVVGSDLVYAAIQNDGGVIRPRATNYLAIPIGKMADKALAPWPRTRNDLTLIKSKKGNLVLAKISKSGKIDPQYVLKPSVSIKGKHYLERALEAVGDQCRAIIIAAVGDRAEPK
jgi:phage gpG-like protein